MKLRWGVASLLAGTWLLSSYANAQQPQNVRLECDQFEVEVKRLATDLKATAKDKKQRATANKQMTSPAHQLAFTLVTGFNMTPHNSGYVANGLCSVQKSRFS